MDTCEIGVGSINLTVTGGTPPYTFTWSNGASTEDLTGVVGNSTYTVTVVDALGESQVIDYYVSNFAFIWDVHSINDFYFNIGGVNNTACTGPPNGGWEFTPLTWYPFNWIWSNGVTTPSNLGLSAGTYIATITLGTCLQELHLSLNVLNLPDAPVLAATSTNATCALPNGSIDLTITESEPPYVIIWSNGETTEDITNLAPGTYAVTVTGANGCTEEESYVISDSVPFDMDGTTTPASSCIASNGAIDLTPSPVGSYTFSWSNGADTEDLSNLAAGSYSVTVTDANGCTGTAQFTVDDTAQPPALNATPVAATCGFSSGSVGLTASGGAQPYAFNWSNGATTEDLSNLPGGTYTVTVTGANGCSATATATVADNSVSINITGTNTPNTTCTGNNGTVNISVSPTPPPIGSYTYAWSNSAMTEDISNLAPGTYIVTVSVGTCTSSASFTVADQPSTPTLFATTAPDYCGGGNGSVDLQPSGGAPPYTFSWSNAATTEDLFGLAAGQYTTTVTGVNGCTATYTATVPTGDVPVFVDGATTPNTSCTAANGSITTSLAPPVPPPGLSYAYLWASGESTPGLNGLQAGSYAVTVTLGNACTTTATFAVDSGPQLPSLSLTATPASCGGPGSVNLTVSGGTPPYGFLWSNMATTEDLPSVPAGSYTVTVTGADGCSATTSATVPNNGSGADTTAIATTTCNLGDVGTFTQDLTGQDGCDSMVVTTVSLLASDTTVVFGTSCDLNDVGVFEQTLVNSNGCDSLIITTITYSASDTTNISGISCDLNDVGVFEQSLVNSNGCDSLIITTIAYSASDTTNIFDTSCDLNYVGVFEQTLTNGNGCDSLIITTIAYSASDTTNIFDTSCDLSDVGVFEQLLTNQGGCDSLIITNIAYSAADTTNISTASCDVSDIGVFEQIFPNSNGCDSLVITTVTLLASDTTALFGTSCNPASVGTFVQNLTNQNGCDSTIITMVVFSLSDTTLLSATTCDPTSAGVFTQNLTTPEGCDSTVITTVALLTGSTTQLSATTCDPTAAGVFIQTLTNANGCDSTVTTTVSLLPGSTTFLTGTTCDPTAAGTFVQNLINANGCDSTVTTTISLLPGSTTYLIGTTCDPTAVGIFVQNLTGQNGCDSTVTTTVSLLPATETFLDVTTCDPTAAGIFVQNLTGQNGCDSTVTMTVALLPSDTTYSFSTTCDASQAGTTSVVYQNQSGCDSVAVAVATWTPPPTLSLSASDFNGFGVTCAGASDGWAQASATGTGPFVFTWGNGSILPLLENLSAGSYAVTVVDGNGCTSEALTLITEPGALINSMVINDLDCFAENGGAITVTASGGVEPYLYSLNANALQSSGTFGGLSAGAYEIMVQDANGCEATDLVAINAPVPLSVELGDDVFLELGDGTTLSALTNVPLDSLAQIIWSGTGNLECPGCSAQQVFPVVTTSYSIQVTDGQGCLASDGVTVYVDRRKNVYVPNAFSPNGDGINDLLLVFAKEGQVKSIKSFLVFDRWGESVYQYFDFQPNNPAVGWDGSHRGQLLNAAVFVWFAEVEFVDGEVRVFEGDVVLVR